MAAVDVDIRTVDQLTPSRERVEPGSFNIPLGSFPQTNTEIPEDPDKIATVLIDQLNSALDKKDTSAVSDLFIENSYWRDHLCLSWDYRTVKGRGAIAKYVTGISSAVMAKIDRSSALKAPHNGPIDGYGEVHGIEFFIKVTSNFGYGRGVVRLAQKGSAWKIFTVFTSLEGLTGHDEAVTSNRPIGVQHGEQQGRTNWKDRRVADENYKVKQPLVLVVGAGQGGLSIAARLKMLNVDTLVVDHEDQIGDSWRQRYHQLVLHDPVWYDHMPYMPFPSSWPIFTPKDKLAEFFECYVKLLELNVWTRTELKSSSWDESKKEWTVVVERKKEDGTTETRTLHPHHVIQATGHSGKKNAPNFKGMENFKGDRICHSSEFPGANPDSPGKKAIVIGSCNSGHDIAQDYFEKGYDVTMVQRSSTCVVSSSSITNIGMKGLYDETGPPTEDADLYMWSIPPELFKTQQIKVTKLMNQNDAKTIEGLEKAGFKVDRGPMDCGLMTKYLQRGGGYYIDVGASQLIVDGKIKVKQGQEISEVLPNGLRFADGSQLEADEIVFATGYQNMRTQARLIFGDEVADRVGNVWGLDEEGEMRNIWRRSGHPGFWFMGGNLALCRYYSRLLALQIKALEAGVAKF
ncbi:uncharacterized protein N7498_006692 [Penicillium cinerascens]|uniref:FAD/NAD(P)-binding domain-containing protein n=1 Tax=Penicillium cinerascens TaxID=70096 RepID=A0A9W9MIS0_9EURO|nr:uncharacterized protein N7498_006692 [Penicillium cinerascens]KAJ5202029.1 hypothetical protein N7498_006692 [Penicillium cinerascens]